MSDRSEWKLSFRRLPEVGRHVVEATFDQVTLHDVDDVEEWERRVREELDAFGPDLLLLIDLSELHIKPRASSAFGETRARVLEAFTSRSFRHGGDGWTRASINTSRALHGADSNLFEDREAALAALREHLAARAAE